MSLNIRPRHGGSNNDFGRGVPWILCELAPVGKRLVRGNPEVRNFWTFCPKKKFPHDKIKISECEKCPHFKGYRKSFTNKTVQSLDELGQLHRAFQPRQTSTQKQPESAPYNLTIIKPKKKEHPIKVTVPLKDFLQALEEKERKDKEWEEEERRIFGDKDENH